jgi:DNA polymerase II small subunit/DNA polymerase delta subunit B
MNHNHIKNLINLGYLVDESIVKLIENIDEDNFYKLVEGLKKENSFMITNELVKKILVRDVGIIKEFTPHKKFTVQDFVKNLNEKYNALQSILLKRLEFSDLISINKISSGNVSVIGFVKDKTENGDNFITNLEDPTGVVQTVITKPLGEKLSLDDVVAVSGRMNNKILFADKIVYPDVPLRPVNYASENVKIAFLEENKDCKADYVFFKNKIKDNIKDKIYSIKNPCLIEINGILILIMTGFNPLETLRKRYVNIENTDFIIDPVPDIIFTDKDVNINYKGITIVSLNKMIDLKTREINDI